MELTKGEFCQFNLNTRIELLREFGKHIMKRKVRTRMISIYRVFGFYVEVYEDLANRKLEKCEPVKTNDMMEFYRGLL